MNKWWQDRGSASQTNKSNRLTQKTIFELKTKAQSLISKGLNELISIELDIMLHLVYKYFFKFSRT